MNLEKRYEIQKCQLKKMIDHVVELELELKAVRDESERTTKLNKELESLQKEWKKTVEDLKAKRKEYEILISQLRILNRQKQ